MDLLLPPAVVPGANNSSFLASLVTTIPEANRQWQTPTWGITHAAIYSSLIPAALIREPYSYPRGERYCCTQSERDSATADARAVERSDRKSTRLNSSHLGI